MKKNLLLLVALAFATVGTSVAQTAPATRMVKQDRKHTPKDPAKMAGHKAEKMAKELGLNADQKAKVEQLLLARHQETAAFKIKYGNDKKAGRADMKAARDRYQTQLKAILTPEQYAKREKMKDEHRGHDHSKMKDSKMKMKDGKMKTKQKA